MKTPAIFDDPAVWKTYISQCKDPELEELHRAFGDIGNALEQVLVERQAARIGNALVVGFKVCIKCNWPYVEFYPRKHLTDGMPWPHCAKCGEPVK